MPKRRRPETGSIIRRADGTLRGETVGLAAARPCGRDGKRSPAEPAPGPRPRVRCTRCGNRPPDRGGRDPASSQPNHAERVPAVWATRWPRRSPTRASGRRTRPTASGASGNPLVAHVGQPPPVGGFRPAATSKRSAPHASRRSEPEHPASRRALAICIVCSVPPAREVLVAESIPGVLHVPALRSAGSPRHADGGSGARLLARLGATSSPGLPAAVAADSRQRSEARRGLRRSVADVEAGVSMFVRRSAILHRWHPRRGCAEDVHARAVRCHASSPTLSKQSADVTPSVRTSRIPHPVSRCTPMHCRPTSARSLPRSVRPRACTRCAGTSVQRCWMRRRAILTPQPRYSVTGRCRYSAESYVADRSKRVSGGLAAVFDAVGLRSLALGRASRSREPAGLADVLAADVAAGRTPSAGLGRTTSRCCGLRILPVLRTPSRVVV